MMSKELLAVITGFSVDEELRQLNAVRLRSQPSNGMNLMSFVVAKLFRALLSSDCFFIEQS